MAKRSSTSLPPQHDDKHRRHALILLLLLALTVGLYGWTLDFPMVFDDLMYLKENPIFLDASSFNYPWRFQAFANLPSQIGEDPDLATNFILRPVAYASLYLNYVLDGFQPRWFRAVNIAIHAINAALIYALLSHLLRRSPQASALPDGSRLFIPATAALLFVVHPLATESVTYIIQRFTSMSTLFYLLTLWLYFVSLHAASNVHRLALRLFSVIALLLGMMTKECVFTAPVMAVVIDILVHGTRPVAALKRALPLLLFLPLIPTLVFLTAAAQNQGSLSLSAALNIVNYIDHPTDHWHYIVSEITVVAAYIQRIIWPAGLNLDPTWPLYRSLMETPVLAALIPLVLLIVGTGWLWHRHRQESRASLAFAFTLWFFITVSVSSGLVPLPDLMADHRSYLPSIGIFTLIACGLDRLRTWSWPPVHARQLFPALTALSVIALAWTTCARNEVWRTAESLWEDTVSKSPGKYRAWGNLGGIYSSKGKQEKAVQCFQKALKIEPRHTNSLFNLSNSLLALNRPTEALESTYKLMQYNQDALRNPSVAFTLGMGLEGVGKLEDALSIFRQLATAYPEDVIYQKALGFVYLRKGQPSYALVHLRQAAEMQPPNDHLLLAIQEAENALKKPVYNPLVPPGFRLR
jgi:Tfp pilus assembly protein PilF